MIIASEPYGLGLEEKTLANYLNQLDYTSHMVGKWHLGMFHKNYTPTYRGFQSYFGYYNGNGDYFDHVHEWQGCIVGNLQLNTFF